MMRSIQGQPGNGKTRFVVKKLIHQLRMWRSDPRPIGINFGDELELPRLNEYLHELDGDDAPDIHSRLIQIPRGETATFFRWRAGGLVLPEPPEKDPRTGKKLPYDEFRSQMKEFFTPLYSRPETAEGVVYFIDEVHDYFNAREWMENGRGALYYMTKHRHLLDDFWWISQAPEQVEATVKRLTSEFFEVRNHYRESFGLFRKQGKFVWSAYYKIPSPSEKPFDGNSFLLDPKGEASCYRTTGALGSKNGKPEKIQRPKKLPFWVLPIAVVLAIWAMGALIMAVPKMSEKGMSGIMGGVMKGANHSAPVSGVKQSGGPPPGSSPPAAAPGAPKGWDHRSSFADKPSQPVSASAPGEVPREDFKGEYVRFSARRNDRMNFLLTGGRTLTEKGPEPSKDHVWDVVADDRQYITVRSGERIYKQQHLPTSAPVVARPVQAARAVETPPPVVAPVAEYKGEGLFDASPSLGVLGNTYQRPGGK